MDYAKLLKMDFFTCHTFSKIGKTQDLPSKIWQTVGDAYITGRETKLCSCPSNS
jgi:hypothetical protein